MNDSIPHWLSALGTGEVIAFVVIVALTAFGVARLVAGHSCLQKGIANMLTEQRQVSKQVGRLLGINLWEAKQRADENGGSFPPWAAKILEEEFSDK